MGVISLMLTKNNNRGFWLAPEFQQQGYMREACEVVNEFWFTVLDQPVLRVEKARANHRSRKISETSGMRLIATGKKHYVSGYLDSEVWELTRDVWQANQHNQIAQDK